MKLKLIFILMLLLSAGLFACNGNEVPTIETPIPTIEPTPEPTPIPTPVPTPEPTPDPYAPLILAIDQTNTLNSYTLLITFETETETFDTTVYMTNTTSRVDALDEITYYEVDGNICYIYEQFDGIWTKEVIQCSQKGTLELSFLINFSADFFNVVTTNEHVTYELKPEHYQSLELFFDATLIENYVMTLKDDLIHVITFQMTRNSIVFDMTFEVSNPNSTVVTLPIVTE